jgi:hypothetical protein
LLRQTIQDVQIRAVTPPTDISILPVIITTVSPQAITISAAFSLKRLKSIWILLKPLSPRNIMDNI